MTTQDLNTQLKQVLSGNPHDINMRRTHENAVSILKS